MGSESLEWNSKCKVLGGRDPGDTEDQKEAREVRLVWREQGGSCGKSLEGQNLMRLVAMSRAQPRLSGLDAL